MKKQLTKHLKRIPKQVYPLIFIAVFIVVGALILNFTHAQTPATLNLSPTTGSIATGATVTVQVSVSSGSDPVNAVEADLTYDQNKLQFISSDVSQSAFGVEARNIGQGGTVTLARGSTTPVTGNKQIAAVTFKALATGTTTISFANSSAVVSSEDNQDFLGTTGSATFTIGGTSSSVPASPTGLAAPSKTTASVTLTWSASTGATSYIVYRDGVQVGTPTGATFTDTGLTANTQYTYKVTAKNTAGNSPQSNALSVTTSQAVPAVPVGLNSLSHTAATVQLGWTAVSGATSYIVYRDGAQIGTPSTTSFTDTGLTASKAYSYTVAAKNTAGTSAKSSAVSVTTSAATGGSAPAAPTGLSLNNDVSQAITLTWSASSGATGYNIYRNGVKIGTSTTTSYADTNLTGNTNYTYTVSAFNAAGTSAQTASTGKRALKQGDVNADGVINAIDVSLLSYYFSPTTKNAPRTHGDLNHDGVINAIDVSILSYYFGK